MFFCVFCFTFQVLIFLCLFFYLFNYQNIQNSQQQLDRHYQEKSAGYLQPIGYSHSGNSYSQQSAPYPRTMNAYEQVPPQSSSYVQPSSYISNQYQNPTPQYQQNVQQYSSYPSQYNQNVQQNYQRQSQQCQPQYSMQQHQSVPNTQVYLYEPFLLV